MFSAGAGVAGVTKKVAGVVENDTGSNKPSAGKEIIDTPTDVGPGRQFQGADKSIDVRNQVHSDAKPSVDDLMGVNKSVDDEGQIDEFTTERGVKSAPGRTLSDNLTTTPELQQQQKDTKVSIADVLDDMKISQTLKRSKVLIQNNERHLEDLEGLYSEAVLVEDHEEALSLAEEYKEVAGKQIESVSDFITAREKDMGKKKTLLSQTDKDDVTVYTNQLGTKSGNMVTAQVQAIRMKENQEFMDWND